MQHVARAVPRRKPGDLGRWEILRRLRYGDLRKLFRHRWGHVLPDDESGRGDLFELVCNMSLAPSATAKKITNVIEVWAPWMSKDESALLVEHVGRLAIYERTPTARELGERMNLTDAERKRLNIRTVLPADVTDEDLAERRKRRKRERDARQRSAKGIKTRAAYLEEARKPKPWEASNVSRRTWFRRNGTGSAAPCTKSTSKVALGQRSTILTETDVYPVPSVCAESRQGHQGRGVAKLRTDAETAKGERENERGSRANDADPVPHDAFKQATDVLRARAAEAWRNRNAKG